MARAARPLCASSRAIVLLIAASLAALAPIDAARAPAEISQNAIITSLYDVEQPEVETKDGKITRCEAIVRKSKETGAKSMGVVITIAARGSERTIGFYQYQDGFGGFVKVDKPSIARFRAGLQKCFKAAVDAGFKRIHVLPHVDIYEVDPDSGAQKNLLWRNVVRFDPLVKHGSPPDAASYEDVLLAPAAAALKEALKDAKDVDVEFALAGEQGLSVFTFPGNWGELMGRMRGELGGVGGGRHTFGVSFNWNKVCGCVEPRERDPLLYNRTYTQRLDRWRRDEGKDDLMGPGVVDVEGTKALLDKSDFVGISGYAPLVRPLKDDAMEISWETAAYELGLFGISIKDLAKAGKKLVYSEHGLGGCYWDYTVAPNLEFVKLHPWVGHWPNNGYDPKTNPWLKGDYKGFRQEFYDTVIDWAQRGGGPQYQIDGIYTWSVGSFDVANVFPSTTNEKGSYSDPKIAASIKASNEAVNSGKPYTRPHTTFTRPPPPAPPAGKGDAAAQGGKAFGGALKELAHKYGIFARMAVAAGLTAPLNATATRATILAPTDEAMATWASKLGSTPDRIFENQILIDHIAAYHVITRQVVRKQDLTPGRLLTPVRGGGIRVIKGADGALMLKGVQAAPPRMRPRSHGTSWRQTRAYLALIRSSCPQRRSSRCARRSRSAASRARSCGCCCATRR
ncbi:MAG: hypothetical protein J3K34DRAFT_215181 [Monoraphidium minutum]|nr:MAG: hypothetical protein J3K34DRAFT_215181 [Monoraphidium minutum]